MPTLEEKRLQLKRALLKQKIEQNKTPAEPPKESLVTKAIDTAKDFKTGIDQSLAFSLGDEIGGASGAAFDSLGNLVTDSPVFNPEKSLLEKYRFHRDRIRAEEAAQRERSPIATTVGNVLGGLAIPNPVKGAGLVKQAVSAAAEGGLYGLGTSEADITKGALPEALADTATGAGLGAGFSAGANAIASGGAKAIQGLKTLAENRAFKAATGQNKKAFKEAYQNGQITTRGRDLLEADEAGPAVVGWFDSVKNILPKAKEKTNYYGKKIGELTEQVDNLEPNAVNGKSIADKILNFASELPETEQNKPIIRRLINEAKNYWDKGNMSFTEAAKYKGSYKFKPTDSTTQVYSQDGSNALRYIVSKEMEDTVDALKKTTDSEQIKALLGKYKELKQKYSSYKGAAKTAEGKVLDDLSNRAVSPSDYAMGAVAGLAKGGLSLPSAAAAVGGATANKLARTRGSAFVARGSDWLDQLIKKLELEKAGQAVMRSNIPQGVTAGTLGGGR